MPSDKVMQTKAYASTHYSHVEKKPQAFVWSKWKKETYFIIRSKFKPMV